MLLEAVCNINVLRCVLRMKFKLRSSVLRTKNCDLGERHGMPKAGTSRSVDAGHVPGAIQQSLPARPYPRMYVSCCRPPSQPWLVLVEPSLIESVQSFNPFKPDADTAGLSHSST